MDRIIRADRFEILTEDGTVDCPALEVRVQ